jgi:hypothetical protein
MIALGLTQLREEDNQKILRDQRLALAPPTSPSRYRTGFVSDLSPRLT